MSNIQKQHKISPAIAWLTIQKFIIFYCPLDGEHTTFCSTVRRLYFHDMVHYFAELYSIRGCRKYLPPAVHRTVTFVCGSDLSDHHRRCKESRRDLFLYDTDHVHALHCRLSRNTGSEF